MGKNKHTLSQEEREVRVRAGIPVELIVIRHAEPDWGSARVAAGDPGLTDYGRQQARALAAHLQEKQVAALFCSPLRRAMETAAAIAEPHHIEPIVIEDLAEIRVPSQSANTQSEVDAYFRSASNRPLTQHWEGFPGGESFHAFHTRISRALTALLHPYGVSVHQADGFDIWNAPARASTLRLALVAHGGTNSVVLTHLLGILPVPWNGSVSRQLWPPIRSSGCVP